MNIGHILNLARNRKKKREKKKRDFLEPALDTTMED